VRGCVKKKYTKKQTIFTMLQVSPIINILGTTANAKNTVMIDIFQLCQLPYQTSLTFYPVVGSTFGLWPLFRLRDEEKRKEMTGTQHLGTL
jgi:hypothetical protein